jgi:hypothetical protein
LGLVASLARPGGNATGINFFAQEVTAKRVELLHELVPKAARMAVLVNPANIPTAEAALRDVPEAARAIGLQIQVLNASTSREIEAAFAALVRDRADALFVAADGFFNSRRVQLAIMAARHVIPSGARRLRATFFYYPIFACVTMLCIAALSASLNNWWRSSGRVGSGCCPMLTTKFRRCFDTISFFSGSSVAKSGTTAFCIAMM